MASLERRLAFTRGVVTYHFRDKDDIVMAVLDSAIADIAAATRAAVERSATPQDQVRAALRAVLEGFLEQVEATRVLLSFWGRLATDARIRERNARLYAAYRRQSARLLRDGIASGAFRAVDVETHAALMVGVILGLVTQAHFAPGAVDPRAAVDEAAEALLARLRARS